jgi:glutaredoxin
MLAIVYTKDNCPACKQLKERFIREGQFFEEVHIGKDITREEFMEKFPSVRQVPHVVYKDK